MPPTSTELQLGASAHEQVRIYEKYTALNRKQLPLIFVVVIALLLFTYYILPKSDHDNFTSFFPLPFFMLMAWFQHRSAKKLYANNKLLLRLLQDKYGDSLPWIQGEKDLATSHDLEAAIKSQQTAI